MNNVNSNNDKNRMKLWYSKPAYAWNEALPIGNGRMGGMVYGNPVKERIELSEISCWSGERSDRNNSKKAPGLISEIRQALFQGEYKKAHTLADGIIGSKQNFGTNLPLGNLWINMDTGNTPWNEYFRELDLNDAVVKLGFTSGNTYYRREGFISCPRQIIAIRLTAGEPGKINFNLAIDGGDNPHCMEIDRNGDLLLTGNAYETIHSDGKTGVQFQGRVRVKTDKGIIYAKQGKINVENADTAYIYVALGTNFLNSMMSGNCLKRLEDAAALPYDELKTEHTRDFQKMFNRVSVDFGHSDCGKTSIDKRLENLKNGKEDHELMALMFQYGRYLLISSSRENSPLPAHLQGVWNDGVACRIGWSCDMHLDINTQMNYWPSEVTNLSECNHPLFQWLKNALVPSGRITAKETYGLNGWVAHVFSNAWGYTAPGWSTHWGIHVTGGVWIAMHLWEHYMFTEDVEFLRRTAYPILKEAAEFFTGYLTEDPNSGFFVTGPSCSPENQFKYNDEVYSLAMGNTCDIAFVRELFNSCMEASKILGLEGDFEINLKEIAGKLPPFKIGSRGQLQEWEKDYTEAIPNHRHTSHILSLFPLGQINLEKTPELITAAKISLENRLNAVEGWEDTGWSRSLQLLYSARMQDEEKAFGNALKILGGLTAPNLMAFHPPAVADVDTWVYELDGNTGFTSGIAEMLLQSYDGMLILLPALPESFKNGYVKGLCARGGYVADIYWKDGKLDKAVINSKVNASLKIGYRGKFRVIDVKEGNNCVSDKEFDFE
jgi:alpha-L-fucosidase 2